MRRKQRPSMFATTRLKIRRMAKKFQYQRLNSGYVQREVADLLGLTRRAVGQWESGITLMPIWHAFRLCQKTGGLFRAESIRPDFIQRYHIELKTLQNKKIQKRILPHIQKNVNGVFNTTWFGAHKQKNTVIKQFRNELKASSFTVRDIANLTGFSPGTVRNWGRTIKPNEPKRAPCHGVMSIEAAFELQKKTKGVFLVERLRPDFIREFQYVIDDLKI